MGSTPEIFGFRKCPLTDAQMSARRPIAAAYGAEFDVMAEGTTCYSIPPRDAAHLDAVKQGIRQADLALNDDAPPAEW